MAQTQEIAHPDGPPHASRETPVAAAVAESRNRQIKGAPARLGEALALAQSDAVRRLLQIAGWMAVSHSEDHPSVDGRDLFVAALKAAEDITYESALTWFSGWIKQTG